MPLKTVRRRKRLTGSVRTRLRAKKKRRRSPAPSSLLLLRSESAACWARADGIRNVFAANDFCGSTAFSGLPHPSRYTIVQLHINGVLQPGSCYSLTSKGLRLLSGDPPAPDVPILLLYIRLLLPQESRRTAGGRSGRRSLPFKSGQHTPPPPWLKPVITASSLVTGTVLTETATLVREEARRFTAAVTAAMIHAAAGNTVIPAAAFLNDEGEALIGLLPLPGPGGAYNVFVNGILQPHGLTALSGEALTLRSALILPGTPVILEMHDYARSVSASRSVPALTVETVLVT